MTHSAIYVGDNTHVIEVVDLQDFLGVVQPDAVVQLTSVVDVFGVAVPGFSLPISLTHVANGLYRATIPVNSALMPGRVYRATVKATGAQGYKGEWVERLVSKVRQA